MFCGQRISQNTRHSPANSHWTRQLGGLVPQIGSARFLRYDCRPDQLVSTCVYGAEPLEASAYTARFENADATASRGLPAQLHHTGTRSRESLNGLSPDATFSRRRLCRRRRLILRCSSMISLLLGQHVTTAGIVSLLNTIIYIMSTQPNGIVISQKTSSLRLLILGGGGGALVARQTLNSTTANVVRNHFAEAARHSSRTGNATRNRAQWQPEDVGCGHCQ